jgi:PBP1b-binding outer membrane lipoprotein LpoB
MAQQSFAGLAVLIALTFAIMALHGCASSEQQAVQTYGPAIVAPPEPETTTPEFHGARIGQDALRSRVPSED